MVADETIDVDGATTKIDTNCITNRQWDQGSPLHERNRMWRAHL